MDFDINEFFGDLFGAVPGTVQAAANWANKTNTPPPPTSYGQNWGNYNPYYQGGNTGTNNSGSGSGSNTAIYVGVGAMVLLLVLVGLFLLLRK